MTYNRNDIVKVVLSQQQRFMAESYRLTCPYVRLVRYHDTNSQTAMVYVTLQNMETGRMHPDFAMNIDLDNSVLEREAYADTST